MTARNSRASRAFTRNAITMEKIRVEGARTAMRMSIWKVFWRFVTSVVSRVTMLPVENLSMFEKEYFCTA